MWSDNESELDLLGFQHLADGVCTLVQNVSLLPVTIGVFGDWGSGKSTLLKMIKTELEKGENTVVLTFNGWLFEGYEDAKIALMGSILDALTSKRPLKKKALELVGKLLKRINWMRVASAGVKHAAAFALAGPAGVALTASLDVAKAAEELTKSDPAENVAKFLKDDPGQTAIRGVREFRDDFAELLTETGADRLVVMVDDLDRCNPETVIETLEAIKLFLFVPKTAFILGADERLVRYAVRRRFPELDQPGERIEVGIQYLEKLIQFPIRIPSLGHREIETYINLLFASIAKGMLPANFEMAREKAVNPSGNELLGVTFNHGIAQELFGEVPEELAQSLAMAHRLAPVLTVGLSGNPRQCKRFLNTLLVRERMAASRGITLVQTILAKLMLLEYFKPEWFKRLAELQAAQDGKPVELNSLEAKARTKTARSTADLLPADGAKSATVANEDSDARSESPAELLTQSPHNEPTAEFQTWISDSWMRDWLKSVPPVTNVDLRPYFFFARDTLSALGPSVRRLSPAAQETLNQMLQESDAQRMLAIKNAGKLSASDAAAVFEALVAQMELEEDLGDAKSTLWKLCDWVGARTELKGQIVTAFGRLPDHSVPPGLPARLKLLTQGTDCEGHAEILFAKWSKSTTNHNLSVAAKRYV